MKKFKLNQKIIFLFFVVLSLNSFAGTSSGGGGDHFTVDFINTATQEVYPWLVKNEKLIQPALDAKLFLKNIEDIAERIESKDVVYESCDESQNGRIVAACYNSVSDRFYINQKLYPIDLKNSSSKRLLVMHEIFRRMGLEGDKYEITRKVSMTVTNPETMSTCMINYYRNAGFRTSEEKNLAIQVCEKTGGDLDVQKCVVRLKNEAGFLSYREKLLAVDSCESSSGSIKFQNFIVDLYKKADFRTYEDKKMAIETYFNLGSQ